MHRAGPMTRRKGAVVLGATGHVGQAIVRELLARGFRVTAATRQHAAPSLAGLKVRVAQGDADAPGQFNRWIEGHDIVVDAAAPHPLSIYVPDGREEQDPVTYARHRTRAMLDAVARHGARLVFIGSFTTLPRHDTGLAAIEARMRRSVYPYFGVKQLMEDMVLDAAHAGLPALILNPSAFLGPGDSKPEDSSFARMVMARRLPVTMSHVINVIDVRDVAANVCAALAARRYGVRIPLAGHDIAVDDLARRIATLAGVAPPGMSSSTRVAAIAAFWGEFALSMAGRAAPHALRAVPLIADAGPMEHSTEQRALGVRIRPLDETLRDTVHWHLANDAH